MSVVITKNTATPALQQIWDRVAPGRRKGLMNVLGREAERQYRSWFRQRESDSPNKHGWPRQHFWARIRNATALDTSRTTDDRAVLTVSDPALAAHVNGAIIRPKEARMLAIPLRAEAYGVRPRAGTIPGLFVLKTDSGAFLAAPDPADKASVICYWRLAASVRIPKDPRALPPAQKVTEALQARALAWFFRPAKGATS